MPHRFEGRKLPAKLYAYPFDHVVAVVLVAVGVVTFMFPRTMPGSISNLVDWASIVFRLMALAGGILVSIGLTKGEHRWSFTSEMVGMVLAAGVFGTYSIGLLGGLTQRPSGMLAFIFMTAWSLACLMRARAISIESTLRLKLLIEAGEIQRRDNVND